MRLVRPFQQGQGMGNQSWDTNGMNVCNEIPTMAWLARLCINIAVLSTYILDHVTFRCLRQP